MSCPTPQSGQGSLRHHMKIDKHIVNPGSARNKQKRKYYDKGLSVPDKSLSCKRAELIELTKDVVDLTVEEMEQLLEEDYHE